MKVFIRTSFPVLWYRGSRKLVTARRQNHLVLVALLYSRASSSCHVVKLPVSPLMFLPPFSGVFYIRNLWISCKVSPLFDGNVIRTNGHFCDEFRMGRCDFPVDCGNSIEEHNGTGPSPPPLPSLLAIVKSPRYQVDTYVYSLLLVRARKN